MRHEIAIEGEGFRLRPVAMEDAAFIVQLRSDPKRSRFIHSTSPNLSDQEQWLRGYFERSGDYYFIIEERETTQAEGVVAIYDLDSTANCAEWGRWVLRPGSVGAVESALLVYRVAFEVLRLDMVYCRTAVENMQVVLFHKSVGLVTHAELPKHFQFSDGSYDAIEQRMTRGLWEKRKAELETKARWYRQTLLRSDLSFE